MALNGLMISKRLSRATINSTTMWVILAIVVLAPLPRGGIYPVVWSLTLLVLSALGLVYFIAHLLISTELAVSLSRFRFLTIVLSAFLIYAVAQILPITAFVPSALLWFPAELPQPLTISISPNDSLLVLFTWLNVLLVGFFSMQVSGNAKRADRFMLLLFLVSVTHAISGYIMLYELGDTLLFMEKTRHFGSMTGSFTNRNTFATLVASGAALGLVCILRSSYAKERKSLWGLLAVKGGIVLPLFGWVVAMGAVVASQSRMGLFVGIVGLIVVLLLTGLKRLTASAGATSTRSRLLIGASAVVLMAILVVLYGSGTLDRLETVDFSAESRWSLYVETWRMIEARSLLGFGGGTFQLAFPLFHSPAQDSSYIWSEAHNSYLGLLSDYGLFFGSLPIVALTFVFFVLLRRHSQSSTISYPVVAALAVIVIASIHALVDFSLEIQGYALYFAAVVGCGLGRVAGASRRSDEKD